MHKKNDFKERTPLEIVHFSNNSLYSIEPDSFIQLHSLKTLGLCNNRLSCVQDLSLNKLPLKELSLAENKPGKINANNIPQTIKVIELSYEQLQDNIQLLNTLCPTARVIIPTDNSPHALTSIENLNNGIQFYKIIDCTRDLHIEDWEKIFHEKKLTELRNNTFMGDDIIIKIGILLFNKAVSLKNQYCSIL